MSGCAVPDVERGQFAEVKPLFWQTDTAIAHNSWCYTQINDYKSARSIVCDLVDIVSKNGTLLLKVGPKADGTIGPEDTAVLKAIGAWMKVNSEAICDTHVWRTYGEGPTKVEEGQFTDANEKVFTPEDIRFTVRGENLYATVLKWPKDGRVTVRSLAGARDAHKMLFQGVVKRVQILGCDEEPEWKRNENGLHISAPGFISDMPVVIKLTLDTDFSPTALPTWKRRENPSLRPVM